MISTTCSKKEKDTNVQSCTGIIKKFPKLGFEISIPEDIENKTFYKEIKTPEGIIHYGILSLKILGTGIFVNIKTRTSQGNETDKILVEKAVKNEIKINPGKLEVKKEIFKKKKDKGVFLKISSEGETDSKIHEIRVFARKNRSFVIDIFGKESEIKKYSKTISCLSHTFTIL